MNLALIYCWKEWRAQRGLLISYTLLIFACLCLGLFLAPRHYWFEEGFGTHALTWFVAAGVIGVVAFAVPGLVRGEFAAKEDQFVRRLPGALRPAFGGKLLFLVLVTTALPLLALLVGELFVTSLGHSWDSLFRWQWDGQVHVETPRVIVLCGFALLLMPWVWAVGLWTPGGRLAVLAAVLLVLLIAISFIAVVRQSPHIETCVAYQSWLWSVPASGLIVAAVSWLKGRLGGGPMRSARFGLLATFVLLLPGAAWLGERVHRYHHPDSSRLQQLYVTGICDDNRFLLAHISEHGNWRTVPVRIDLESGEAEVISSIHTAFDPGILRPAAMSMEGQQQHWMMIQYPNRRSLFDLSAGTTHEIGYDEKQRRAILAPEFAAEVHAARRADSFLSAPEGVRVWVAQDEICFETADGEVTREPWPATQRATYRAAGHGLRIYSGNGEQVYDLAARRMVDTDGWSTVLVVGDCHLLIKKGGRAMDWRIRRGDHVQKCEGLDACRVFGLFDDRRVLAQECRGHQMFLFEPATGTRQEIDVPAELLTSLFQAVAPLNRWASLLDRDPQGHIWFRVQGTGERFVRIDPATLRAEMLPLGGSQRWGMQLLSWADCPEVLVRDGLEIVRVNLESGNRVVQFPR